MKQPTGFILKICIASVFFFLLSTTLPAQSATNQLYGFVQAVIPGAAASDRITNLDGTEVENKTRNIRLHYHIYVATTAKTRVYPIKVWIKGEPYSARPETVAATPIEITTGPAVMGRAQKTVLVPKTTQFITQLIPTPLVDQKHDERATRLAAQNELVVVYRQGGKTYISTLKTLTELSPLVRE